VTAFLTAKPKINRSSPVRAFVALPAARASELSGVLMALIPWSGVAADGSELGSVKN
jgi:hypothetical protein